MWPGPVEDHPEVKVSGTIGIVHYEFRRDRIQFNQVVRVIEFPELGPAGGKGALHRHGDAIGVEGQLDQGWQQGEARGVGIHHEVVGLVTGVHHWTLVEVDAR